MFKHCFVAVSIASFSTFSACAQSFIGEGFSSAIEAVQDGLDLIWPDKLNLDGVSARIGFGIGLTPDHQGSNEYRLRIIPLIDIRYKDRLQLNGSRLSFVAYQKNDFSIGPLINLRFGRNENQNEMLAGFGNISGTLQVGGFVRYKTKEALVSAEYRHGLGAGIGSSMLFTAGHGIYQNGKFSAMVAGQARWLSKKTMQTNFGLTSEQSKASVMGLSEYTPGAGVSEINANLVGSYEVNDRIRVLALVSYGKLLGNAADSPIVADDNGSSTQIITGIGLAVAF